jgi:hypothetical protein
MERACRVHILGLLETNYDAGMAHNTCSEVESMAQTHNYLLPWREQTVSWTVSEDAS